MSSLPVVRFNPPYDPKCECGCKDVIARQKELMRQSEAWATYCQQIYEGLKKKYQALEGSKEAVDTLVRDIMEENTRLQQENEKYRQRLECRMEAASAQPNSGMLQGYPNSELLPDEAQPQDQGLGRRLLERLAEVSEIAKELAKRQEELEADESKMR